MFYFIAKSIVKVFLKVCFFLKVYGTENIPASGAFILAANHTSNFDPPVAAVSCPRQIRFMAKEELFKNPVFGGLIKKLGAFPVSRGKGDIGAVKTAFSILKNGDVMIIFPQGRRVKSGEHGKAQSGAVMIAHKMQVPIVPLYISGRYKLFHRVTATFGKPIELTEYYGQKLDSEKLKELSDGILNTIFSYDVQGADK